jgi:glucosyl-dolichyl phosphate glucuronosyltransferase
MTTRQTSPTPAHDRNSMTIDIGTSTPNLLRSDLDFAVTVLICAYTERRWTNLVDAYASVFAQLGPADELLVVVDHNERLLADARQAFGAARVLANTHSAGLSGARNTGVAAARGDVIAFLDDDAVAAPDWLRRLREAFDDPAVAVVGTGVTPRWEGGQAPRWFPEEFGWVVGCGYRGLPTTRSAVRNPIGASMAVRRGAFEFAGVFSERVGRVGTLPVGCEETEFCIRLARRCPEAVVVHEPSGLVDHHVPRGRQTLRYFVRRCFFEGRSKRAVARAGGTRAGLSSERRYVRRVLPTGVLRGLGDTARGDLAGLARAAAITVGLLATVAGYATGRG